MDILLLKIETDAGAAKYPPLGLMYIGNALEQEGYGVEIIHERDSPDVRETIRQRLDKEKPLFVGFSTVTSPHLIPSLEISKEISSSFGVPVVWGGIHPTIFPEQILKDGVADVVVHGEGEETVVELAHSLENNRGLSDVKGIRFKEDGKVKINENRPFIQNLDKYSLAWHLIEKNIDKYFESHWGLKRVLAIITSRGCPHRCEFCYNQIVNKRMWRAHSIEKTVEMVNELKKKFHIDGIFFGDDNFFTNKNRALEIVKQVGLPWYGEIRANYVDEELMKRLSETNCKEVTIGAESGSDRTLQMIKKDVTTSQIVRAVELGKKYGVKIDLSFIIGFPNETAEDVQMTLNFITKLRKINRDVTCDLKIYVPYPGAELFEESTRQGFQRPETTQGWGNFIRHKCNLPWVKEPEKYETYCRVCNLAYRKEVPLFSSLERFRMQKGIFNLPLEFKLLQGLRTVLGK